MLIHLFVWSLPIIANSLTLPLREDLYTITTRSQAAVRARNQARLEPPNVATVTFALTPGRASTATLYYITTEGIKLYNKETKGIEPPYDLSDEGLYAFLLQVSHQANQMNWNTIINVLVNVGGVNLTCDLLIQNGVLTLAQVHAHVLTYQGLDGRAAQNSQQMYTLLYESLDAQARMRHFHSGRTVQDNCWRYYLLKCPSLPQGTGGYHTHWY